jgi:hypothetical protein
MAVVLTLLQAQVELWQWIVLAVFGVILISGIISAVRRGGRDDTGPFARSEDEDDKEHRDVRRGREAAVTELHDNSGKQERRS